MDENILRQRILEAYPDAVVDTQGEGCSFEVYVITDAFAGQMPVKRQQAVLKLFSPELASGALHALSVTARTPSEMQDNTGSGLVNIQM